MLLQQILLKCGGLNKKAVNSVSQYRVQNLDLAETNSSTFIRVRFHCLISEVQFSITITSPSSNTYR